MTDRTPGRAEDLGDLEGELAAAMSEYAGKFEPGVYRVDVARWGGALGALQKLKLFGSGSGGRGSSRRRTVAVTVAVAVAAAASAVTLTLEAPAHKPSVPTPTPFGTSSTSTSPAPRPPSMTPPSATDSAPSGAPGAADPLNGPKMSRQLTLAAEMYENPATRARVDLGKVAALFADQASFRRTWGDGGLGVTCGQVADGADGGFLFRGTKLLPKAFQVETTPDSTFVTGVTCQDYGPSGPHPEADYYAGLLKAGQIAGTGARHAAVQQLEKKYLISSLRSHDGSASPTTCHEPLPRAWVIDNPSSGTVVWGYTVTLDEGSSFKIGYGSSTLPGTTGSFMTSVQCGS